MTNGFLTRKKRTLVSVFAFVLSQAASALTPIDEVIFRDQNLKQCAKDHAEQQNFQYAEEIITLNCSRYNIIYDVRCLREAPPSPTLK